MLPTGHLAAGYLVGVGVAKLLLPDITQFELHFFGYWGAFLGFAPDLDVFYAFFVQKSLLVAHKDTPIHRKYFFHAPILWLIVGMLIIYFARDYKFWVIGYLVWLGSWSHFILDSVEYGIMWLWPFNTNVYALFNIKDNLRFEEKNFFWHSFKFLKEYTKKLSFYLEIFIILTAIIIYFN